jgi:heptosyltransferase-2
VAPVLRRMAELDEVIEAPFGHGALDLRARWRLGRSLRARGYDQAIVLPNSWKSALVPFFADIGIRSGYVGESRYGLLNLLYREDRRGAPMALHYARLSEAPGADPKGPLPSPRLACDPDKAAATARRFGLPARYAAFCPGAEYGSAKRWPYFAALSERIGIEVAVLGSQSDRESCEGIKATNLAGRTSLDEAIDLIAAARFVVTNDSGLMHVAAALDTPQVALFGSSSPERTPPLAASARVLWLGLACSPCFARECPLGHFRCMKELSVERVLDEIGRIAQ